MTLAGVSEGRQGRGWGKRRREGMGRRKGREDLVEFRLLLNPTLTTDHCSLEEEL